MAQTAAVDRDHRVAAARGGNVFAFAWRQPASISHGCVCWRC